jgi:mono/diheme cytochrome c family protein
MFKTLFIIATISFVSLSAITRKENHLQTGKGKEVYALHCQSCHMEKGEGMEGVYPPLAKTSYLKDVKKNIKIILEGQSGEITVNGKNITVICRHSLI